MSGGAKVGMFSHYVKTTEMVSYSRFQKMYMQMLWKKKSSTIKSVHLLFSCILYLCVLMQSACNSFVVQRLCKPCTYSTLPNKRVNERKYLRSK